MSVASPPASSESRGRSIDLRPLFNPRSIALVGDEYNRVRNPLVEQFEEAGLDVPESLPRTVAPSRNASELGPSLNVSVNRSDAYGGGGRVLVSVRVGDVLDTGGRIYPDVGAAAQGIRPLVVTVPRAVPYRVESPPAP